MSIEPSPAIIEAQTTGPRRLYMVGSYPGATADEAMDAVMTIAGAHLAVLSDGETGIRDQWIQSIINRFRTHPDLRLRRDGDWSDYASMPRFAVRLGHRLHAASIELGHAAAAAASIQHFRQLRAELDRPDLAFLVGLPSALDLALFSLGPLGALLHRRPFAEALLAEIAEVSRLDGDVVCQLEAPAEQALAAWAPRTVRGPVARWAAAALHDIVRRSPAGTRFGVHLCVGDLDSTALVRFHDVAPLVTLANAVIRGWPAGRPLEFLHLPLCSGDRPPVLDPSFYAGLSGLRPSSPTRLVAGILHELRSVEEHRQILGAIEAAVGSPVDVAAACGLGRRRAPGAAEQVMAIGVELCAG